MADKDETRTITNVLRESDGLGGLPLPAKPETARRSRPKALKVSEIIDPDRRRKTDIEKP